MFMMVCMKHYGEKITTTCNYVIRWMKIILHGSTSLKWIEPINDLMFLCTNFTSTLTIAMDINHYKVCAPWTFKLDHINFNLSLSTIVECTYDDCIVVFFSHRREEGKVGGGGDIGGSYGGCQQLCSIWSLHGIKRFIHNWIETRFHGRLLVGVGLFGGGLIGDALRSRTIWCLENPNTERRWKDSNTSFSKGITIVSWWLWHKNVK